MTTPIYQQPYMAPPMYYPQYPMYNPLQPQQQRLQEMEQQYQQRQTAPSVPLKCRPVTSIDEARAAMIDLDGSVHVFPDFGNKRIYTKQINLDGTATLNTYTLQADLTPEPASAPAHTPTPAWVSQEELDTVCADFEKQLADFDTRLKGYDRAFAALREEKKGATKK